MTDQGAAKVNQESESKDLSENQRARIGGSSEASWIQLSLIFSELYGSSDQIFVCSSNEVYLRHTYKLLTSGS